MIWEFLMYVFYFFNLMDSFFSFFFGFWKFWNCILNQNSYFWGVCFKKRFDLRPPYICFWYFGNLGGLFWVWVLILKISKFYFESEFQLLGGMFYKTFCLRPPYICFCFFSFRESFLSWIFCFWKLQYLIWIKISTFGGSVL